MAVPHIMRQSEVYALFGTAVLTVAAKRSCFVNSSVYLTKNSFKNFSKLCMPCTLWRISTSLSY